MPDEIADEDLDGYTSGSYLDEEDKAAMYGDQGDQGEENESGQEAVCSWCSRYTDLYMDTCPWCGGPLEPVD